MEKDKTRTMAPYKITEKFLTSIKRKLKSSELFYRTVFGYGPQILTKIIDKVQRVVVDMREKDLCGSMDGGNILEDQNEVKQMTLFEEHKVQGFKWCKEFLCGSWSNITEDEFIFTKLGGGLTNLLYTCELSDNVPTKSGEPRRVLLRVYGDIGKDLKMLVKNSVVFCLLSEKRLGPKCYGLYPDGRIEEFIPTNCLRREDLRNKEISAQVARKLAVIHKLDMPLCKEPRFLRELIEHWLAEITNNTTPGCTDPDMVKLATYNLHAELQWLLRKLASLNSPVVFSHNDLQEGNLLFCKNCPDPERQLTVIDLEYCSYNYRGFDFGNHFCEWCYDYQSVQEMPYYSYDEESYPSKSQQFDFFQEYLKAQNKHCTSEELESMYRETNTCALASHMMWGVWSVIQKDKSDIEFGYMDYAMCRFDSYFKLKKKLFPNEVAGV